MTIHKIGGRNNLQVAIAVLLMVAMLLSACQPIFIGQSPVPLAVTPTPSPLRPVSAFFEAAPCPFELPPDETEGQTVTCGYVRVPEQRATTSDRTIRLAVVVFKSRSQQPEPDPVILLAGGPGEKTVQSAVTVSSILWPLRENRDIITFDQRGAGLSEPALDCPEMKAAIFKTLDERRSEILLQAIFDSLITCRDRLMAEGHNLAAYNTTENAADVADIVRALGYEQANLYGGSYGTLLAQAVMRDHPEGLRSVVMGSVLPTKTSFFVHVPVTTVDATLRLLDACAADADCSAAFPDLQQTLYTNIDRLNAKPVPITITNPLDGQSYASYLTGDAIFSNLVVFLYATEIIPVLPQAIYNVAQGDYDLMTQLSSQKLAIFDAVSRGMTYSVMCAEDLISMTPEGYLDIRAQMPPSLAGMADPEDIIDFGFFGICREWGVPEAAPVVKQPVVSDIPVLILSGEFDPVTPPTYGAQVAGHLANSYNYVFPGVGHNTLVASSCARSIAKAFVDDPTTAPNSACLDEMPGVVFDLPKAEATEIALETFTVEEAGFSAVSPVGWEEAGQGTFVRKQTSLDPTGLIYDSPSVSPTEFPQLLVAQLRLEKTLESIGERMSNGKTWTLYSVIVRGTAIDFAVTARGDQGSLLVLMQSKPEERDGLLESVFLPAVDSVLLDEP